MSCQYAPKLPPLLPSELMLGVFLVLLFIILFFNCCSPPVNAQDRQVTVTTIKKPFNPDWYINGTQYVTWGVDSVVSGTVICSCDTGGWFDPDVYYHWNFAEKRLEFDGGYFSENGCWYSIALFSSTGEVLQ